MTLKISEKLKNNGIVVKKGSDCCNKKQLSFVFYIDKKINFDLEKYFSYDFGKPNLDFKKTRTLKYDNHHYSIIAIKNTKQVKVIFKNNIVDNNILSLIEKIIIKYVG